MFFKKTKTFFHFFFSVYILYFQLNLKILLKWRYSVFAKIHVPLVDALVRGISSTYSATLPGFVVIGIVEEEYHVFI